METTWIPDGLTINEQHHLTVGGCDTVELAERYGTPLYVLEEDRIRQTLRAYRRAIEDNYSSGGMVAYASKACCFKEIYRILASEGCGADVVSGAELYTAKQAEFPMEKIYFHGNAKTNDELCMALDYKVGRIVVDNPRELQRLSALAAEKGITARVLLRITPGIDAHTHEFIKTGKIDSKFGFTLSTGEAMEGVRAALKAENIELMGIHCHIGSQIFDGAPFAHAGEVMVDFMTRVREETGYVLPELNLGGGFGIAYTKDDQPLPGAEMIRQVAAAIRARTQANGFPLPYIVMEPGRSVVGPAGLTLYTVENVKDIPGVRTYVSVDGGMTDNPRYILYKAAYAVVLANRADAPVDGRVTVAGRCCESGDLLQEDVPLPACQPGDTVAVLATGAYNYSMSSRYNRLPRPAVVMVREGEARVVVRRETYDDIVRQDV